MIHKYKIYYTFIKKNYWYLFLINYILWGEGGGGNIYHETYVKNPKTCV